MLKQVWRIQLDRWPIKDSLVRLQGCRMIEGMSSENERILEPKSGGLGLSGRSTTALWQQEDRRKEECRCAWHCAFGIKKGLHLNIEGALFSLQSGK